MTVTERERVGQGDCGNEGDSGNIIIYSKEVILITNLQNATFNYNQLDTGTANFLKEKELNIQTIASNMATQVGKELKDARDMLAGNNQYDGVFEKWYTSIGFKKRTVYNLINYHNLVVQNLHNQNLIESLPKSLVYEIAKPSADEELKEKVLEGDITTLKEYKELKASKEEAEQRAKELEHQIADMQEELTTFKTLLNKERIKNKQEPEVIEKEVVKKIEVVPDSVVQRINEYEDKIAELQERAGDLDKAKMELSEYRSQRDKIAEEMAELKGTMRRLHEEYSGKNENLTKQSLVINKFRSSIQPIKKAKGELEQAFSAMTEMSASGKARMMHELEYLYDFADFVGRELERLDTEEVFYSE